MGQMVMEENEVLKTKLDELQEIKKDLDIKVNSLVKENVLLDKQAWTFENKVKIKFSLMLNEEI